MKNKILAATIAVATLASAFSLLSSKNMLPLPPFVPMALRWLAIALIAASAIRRRSITRCILVVLLAGAELGHDWRGVDSSLQFLGTISCRPNRVIIAPLLFGTLVV